MITGMSGMTVFAEGTNNAQQMEQQAPKGETPQALQGEVPSDNGQQPPQVEGLFEEGQSFQNRPFQHLRHKKRHSEQRGQG